MKASGTFPALLERYFVDRLMRQRQVSRHTIASYRDTFRLLLEYAQRQLGKTPSVLNLTDLDAPFVGAFLDHLEQERGNSARSRNVRLAAIHSFFRYAALHAPEHGALAQRVLAIPNKRHLCRPIDFLAPDEVAALLAAPDPDAWTGRRDRALLLLAVQTGLRASELLGLRCEDIIVGPSSYVHCQGKGRKFRNTPLRKDTVAVLRAWLAERQGQTFGSRVSDNHRRSSQPRWIPRPIEKACGARIPRLSFVVRQARDSPCSETHPRHGPAPSWRRLLRHRPMAWTRVHRNNGGISSRRHEAEGTSAGKNYPH